MEDVVGENLDLSDIRHEGEMEEIGAEPSEDLQGALQAWTPGRKRSAY